MKQHGDKICIIAGVGAGKNHFVWNELGKGKNNILLITSRKAIVDEKVNKKEGVADSLVYSFGDKKLVTMTHAKLLHYIMHSDNPRKLFNINILFDFIVIDEAHSIVCDSSFTDSSFQLWAFIDYINQSKIYNAKVIMMTATIDPIKIKLDNDGWEILDFTDKCVNIKPNKYIIITKEQAFGILAKCNNDNKAIYMATKAEEMIKNTKVNLLSKGVAPGTIATIISSKRAEEILSQEDKLINDKYYNYLIDHGELPPGINILLTTSRLKEGINIIDEKN